MNSTPVKRSFRPMVEGLEAREVPTVTVAPQGALLVINSDAASDNVQILQNDDANTIRVINTAGQTIFNGTSSQFTTVRVNLGAGNDSVNYRLVGGSDFEFAKTITMDLGNGTNIASVNLQSDGQGGQADIEAPVTIDIRSLGSNGQVNFNQMAGSKADSVDVALGEIEANATVNVLINLGIGNDTVTVNQTGELHENARLNIMMEGREANTSILNRPVGYPAFLNLDGNDTFRVNLNGDVPDSEGVVNVTMRGGFGNDTLRLTQQGELDGTMTVDMRGGSGTDTITATLLLEDDSEGGLSLAMLGEASSDPLPSDVLTNTDDLAIFFRTVAS